MKTLTKSQLGDDVTDFLYVLDSYVHAVRDCRDRSSGYTENCRDKVGDALTELLMKVSQSVVLDD